MLRAFFIVPAGAVVAFPVLVLILAVYALEAFEVAGEQLGKRHGGNHAG